MGSTQMKTSRKLQFAEARFVEEIRAFIQIQARLAKGDPIHENMLAEIKTPSLKKEIIKKICLHQARKLHGS